jgi:hypothetical protein
MRFDEEGHVVTTPREVQDLAFNDSARLINWVLLPGTPRAIPTHEQHRCLLDFLARRIGVHPKNLFFKGNTKIGFSIAPLPDKIWRLYRNSSDLDLAIVDPDFFHTVDNQVRMWERDPENSKGVFRNRKLLDVRAARHRHKGAYNCFRFFDLPDIPCMREVNQAIEGAPVTSCCGVQRSMTAFIYRDWWSVFHRFDFDLYELRRGCLTPRIPIDYLPAGEDNPRPPLLM